MAVLVGVERKRRSFFSYLREEEAVLTSGMDSSLDLKVPPARPGKKLAERAYGMKLVDRFYRAIDVQAVSDLLCVLAKTGLPVPALIRLPLELEHPEDPAPIARTNSVGASPRRRGFASWA